MRKINLKMLKKALQDIRFPKAPLPGDRFEFLVGGYADYLNFRSAPLGDQAVSHNSTSDIFYCVAVEYKRDNHRIAVEWELEL